MNVNDSSRGRAAGEVRAPHSRETPGREEWRRKRKRERKRDGREKWMQRLEDGCDHHTATIKTAAQVFHCVVLLVVIT